MVSRNHLQAAVELSSCLVNTSTHWMMFNFSLAWMNVSRKKDTVSLSRCLLRGQTDHW